MRQSVRSWLFGAGAIAVMGGMVLAQSGTASAAQARPSGQSASARPAAAAYEPAKRVLHMGDSGPLVKRLQRRLANLHYYPGPIDGKFGQDTIEAVWAFMSAQGTKLTPNNTNEVSLRMQRQLVHPKAPKVLIKHGPKDRVEVNQNDQVLVLYHNNKPELITHVSTGGGYTYPCPGDPSETCGPAVTPDSPPGHPYHALWFYHGWLTVPLGTMYNPVFFIGSAYAIHGDIPVPWYPASHGCIRVWMDIANFFHNKVTVGGKHATAIYVKGKAPYYL
jgi:peptidoglycan hydrolase-like protein with peptidoglycan-binding domain